MCGGVEVRAPPLLPSGLDGSEWSASSLGRFYPREIVPSTHFKGGWEFYAVNIIYKYIIENTYTEIFHLNLRLLKLHLEILMGFLKGK
jgi:hypothetical protein